MMKTKSDVKRDWENAVLQLGMRAAVEQYLREMLERVPCEVHGVTPRLVGEGEAWEIEGCCAAAVERAARELKQ